MGKAYQLKCKFCGRNIVVRASDQCPEDWSDRLAKLVICNRCADYRDGWRRATRTIATAVATYQRAIEWQPETFAEKKKNEKLLQRARANATWGAKLFHKTLSDYYAVQARWDDQLVEELLRVAKQEEVGMVLAAHARSIKGSSRVGSNGATDQPF